MEVFNENEPVNRIARDTKSPGQVLYNQASYQNRKIVIPISLGLFALGGVLLTIRKYVTSDNSIKRIK